MRLGMPSLIALGDIDRQVDMAHELGLDFIELNTDLPWFMPDRLDVARLRELSRESGVEFTLHLPEGLDLASFHGPVLAGNRRLCADALEAASGAGIGLVNMHFHPGVYFTLPDERTHIYERHEEEFRLRLLASFAEIAEIARGLGVTLCIGNASGFELAFVGRALDSLIERGLVQLTWDTGHDGTSGGVHRPVLMRHAGAIRHMHLHDYNATRNHLPLSTGDLDLRGAVAFACDHALSVVIEVKAPVELERSVRALRDSMG